jgi:hypothetical protein
VLSAVTDYSEAISAAKAWWNDKEVVQAAARNDKLGTALRHASAELRNDRETVMIACASSGQALMYASEELQDDKEVALIAVKQDGEELSSVSKRLSGDREVVTAAALQNGNALLYVEQSPDSVDDGCACGCKGELLACEEVALAAVTYNHGARNKQILDRDTGDYVSCSPKVQASFLEHAWDGLCKRKTFMLKAVAANSYALEYASAELASDEGLVRITKRQKTGD